MKLKRLAKWMANAIASLIVAGPVGCYWIMSRLAGRPRAFPGWSQAAALLPGISGAYLRRAFYRLVLAECGPDSHISFGTTISHPTARIDRNVYVGVGCMLGDVTLEHDVLIGSHVSVINGGKQHDVSRLDVPVRLQPGEYPRVTIGADSWIGDRAIVMADVGRHCVVAAGAIVTKPVPDYAIVAGSPARTIGWRRPPDADNEGDEDDDSPQEAQATAAGAEEGATI